ncbi:OLC1v1027758C1 [Oldenlandia corymbosa var. corymbosa]|uniref:OLC1v1027758C1 n=1 Tax=Oldenlandia corymbosa var. corymbosa TaxID=529605 RepID=A0AAV1CD68_OLDCO|nr:OLC1v1027758C1 [Oldenlandia corymbosa var. corymbosa]
MPHVMWRTLQWVTLLLGDQLWTNLLGESNDPGVFQTPYYKQLFRVDELGFGFDQTCNDYKVTKLWGSRIIIQYYEEEDHDFNDLISINGAGSGVFYNGFFHWFEGNNVTGLLILRCG